MIELILHKCKSARRPPIDIRSNVQSPVMCVFIYKSKCWYLVNKSNHVLPIVILWMIPWYSYKLNTLQNKLYCRKSFARWWRVCHCDTLPYYWHNNKGIATRTRAVNGSHIRVHFNNISNDQQVFIYLLY